MLVFKKKNTCKSTALSVIMHSSCCFSHLLALNFLFMEKQCPLLPWCATLELSMVAYFLQKYLLSHLIAWFDMSAAIQNRKTKLHLCHLNNRIEFKTWVF